MPKKNSGLEVLPPTPLPDENTPLLNDDDHETTNPANEEESLEAQAEQERREYEAGHAPVADEQPLRRLLLTMMSLWLCTFLAALDSTVVATLSGAISSSFKSGTAFSWIASGYVISNAACQPLSGKLTDIYGRRAGLVFATVFFTAGTLLCGLAKNANMMIAGRVIAGMGGGCFNTISTFVASDLIPLRQRGVWQGIGNVVFGLGMGLGGVYGGFVHERLHWSYAFLFQVPFIVLGGIFSIYAVRVPIKKSITAKIKRVDFLGALTLVTSLVLLLLGLNSGGNTVPWDHPLVYVSLPLSAVFLAIFAYVEHNVAVEPIIPLHLLLNQSVAAACLTCWFATMSTFAIFYYVPIYFQVIRNVGATQAGVLFVSQAFGTSLGSLGTGILMRATGRYRLWNMFIQTLAILAAVLILTTFKATVSKAAPFAYLFISGIAYGSMLTITLISLISAVDHRWQAIITSTSYAFRSTGSSIGITVSSAVFQNILKLKLYERFGDLPGAAQEIQRIRNSVEHIKDVPKDWYPGVITSHVEALRGVWVTVLGFAVLAGFVSLFIKEHTLHKNLSRS